MLRVHSEAAEAVSGLVFEVLEHARCCAIASGWDVRLCWLVPGASWMDGEARWVSKAKRRHEQTCWPCTLSVASMGFCILGRSLQDVKPLEIQWHKSPFIPR